MQMYNELASMMVQERVEKMVASYTDNLTDYSLRKQMAFVKRQIEDRKNDIQPFQRAMYSEILVSLEQLNGLVD